MPRDDRPDAGGERHRLGAIPSGGGVALGQVVRAVGDQLRPRPRRRAVAAPGLVGRQHDPGLVNDRDVGRQRVHDRAGEVFRLAQGPLVEAELPQVAAEQHGGRARDECGGEGQRQLDTIRRPSPVSACPCQLNGAPPGPARPRAGPSAPAQGEERCQPDRDRRGDQKGERARDRLVGPAPLLRRFAADDPLLHGDDLPSDDPRRSATGVSARSNLAINCWGKTVR